MKAANFRYERPASLEDALRILDSEGPAAKLIAGGQSLGPMLNLRVVQPPVLIDISALAELRSARVEGYELVVGACVTHADLEDGRAGGEVGGALAKIAGGIAYRAVRNRGTIGGSLCHADPAADWVATLPALGAIAVIRGLRGERRLTIENFVTGALTNALSAGEILVAVRVPRSSRSLFGYAKSCRKVGEFSKASAAILVDPKAMTGRIALGALDGAPTVLDANRLLRRGNASEPLRLDPEAVTAALVAAGLADPIRRHIHAAILARAAREIA
jgi:aerobic carbon-monoxide dehydrogenase medium subunit